MLGPELDQELIKELAKSGPVVGALGAKVGIRVDTVHKSLSHGNIIRHHQANTIRLGIDAPHEVVTNFVFLRW
eukprot:jgi/Pico_ML_1/51233/g2305.t1